MLIFDSNSRPIIIESLRDPVVTTHCWVLNLEEQDFMLSEISYIEEVVSPSIELDVSGFRFYVPASWYILVADKDTAMVDAVRASDISCNDFTALVYGPNKSKADCLSIRAVNYRQNHPTVGPSLHKNEMLCHPIDSNSWICIGSSDPYSRYLKRCSISDFLY